MKYIKKHFLITAFVAVVSLSLAAAGWACALSIKVIPANIDIKTTIGSVAHTEIVVENPTSDVSLYEVYSEQFSDWISVSPGSFILEAKESQKAVIEISPKEIGAYLLNISVVARPLTQKEFQTAAGVKMPLRITVSGAKSKLVSAFLMSGLNKQISVKFLLIFIIIASAAAFLFYQKLVRLKKANNHNY